MSYSQRLNAVKSSIDTLITNANATTGNSDTKISTAVQSLIDGYGKGGTDNEDGLIDGTLSGSYSNDRVTKTKSHAFYANKSITSIDLSNVTDVGEYSFNECTKLTSVNLPLATYLGRGAFIGCSALTTINIPEATNTYATSSDTSTFYNCPSLVTLDLPKMGKLAPNSLRECSALLHLILRKTDTICTYLTTSSNYDPKNANLKIYVPYALLDTYKTASNWSRLSSKFAILQNYTEDGTTTGTFNPDLSQDTLRKLEVTGDGEIDPDVGTAHYDVYYLPMAVESIQGVTWSCTGHAEIDENGDLTVTDGVKVGEVITVTATSTFDTSISASTKVKYG